MEDGGGRGQGGKPHPRAQITVDLQLDGVRVKGGNGEGVLGVGGGGVVELVGQGRDPHVGERGHGEGDLVWRVQVRGRGQGERGPVRKAEGRGGSASVQC